MINLSGKIIKKYLKNQEVRVRIISSGVGRLNGLNETILEINCCNCLSYIFSIK